MLCYVMLYVYGYYVLGMVPLYGMAPPYDHPLMIVLYGGCKLLLARYV